MAAAAPMASAIVRMTVIEKKRLRRSCRAVKRASCTRSVKMGIESSCVTATGTVLCCVRAPCSLGTQNGHGVDSGSAACGQEGGDEGDEKHGNGGERVGRGIEGGELAHD